jgi:hypothetical protein
MNRKWEEAFEQITDKYELHEELLGLDELLQDQGRPLYQAMTVEDWFEIIGVLSNLSERSGAIARICLEIHQSERLM